MVIPVRISASGTFGVITVARFSSSVVMYFMPAAIQQFRTARRFHHRIVHDMREFVRVQKFRHHRGVSAVAQHSDLHRRDSESFASTSSCARSVALGVF